MEAGLHVPHVWFPHDRVVSLVSLLESDVTAETGTIGREGMVGLVATHGNSHAVIRALVRIAGTASRMEQARFQAALTPARPYAVPACATPVP
jgi:hypothetical protein